MSVAVRVVGATEAEARLDELAGILLDAVAHGASVNFMAGFTRDDARAFWQGQVAAFHAGEKQLIVGEQDGRLVGTVMLIFAHQPNAPFRAEIGKMLVHSALRRQGLGRRLLAAAESAALQAGRTLLLLDTETGGAGERLYRGCGWREIGQVPDYFRKTDGALWGTTFFYKKLEA
jgi:GNAT superfamily N-acetyltransferase